MGRGAAFLVVVVALQLGAAAKPAPAAGENENTDQASLTRTFITSADGTRLETNVYRPLGVPESRTVPVIVYVSPYVNTGANGFVPQPHGRAVTGNFPYDLEQAGLFERGYAFVQVALRGTGGSEGCNDLGGRGEQADAVAAVEWAARQPWSNGRVGIVGHSYDGWTGLMALANEPEGLRAVVADAPIVNPYEVIHMNRVTYLSSGYIADVAFQYYDLLPPALASGQEAVINALSGTATDPGCYAEEAVQFRNPDPGAPAWTERNLRPRLRGSRTPVLLSFGFGDELVRPTQFPSFWSGLAGPKHAWFGQWGHNAASAPDPGSWWPDDLVGRRGFSAATMRFFDRHLAGRKVRPLPGVVIERSDGKWRSGDRWPPAGARQATLDLQPGKYRDVAGNSADGRGVEIPQAGRLPALGTGIGSWSASAPLDRPVQISGIPRLRLTLEEPSPAATLIAIVYDIAADGTASVISRGATRAGGSARPGLNLYPQDWLVRKGHRIGLLLSGSDDSTFTPGMTLGDVSVSGGRLRLPLLCRPAAANLSGNPSAGVVQRRSIQVGADAIEGATGPLRAGDRGPVCGSSWWRG